jgi:hypothetical protein
MKRFLHLFLLVILVIFFSGRSCFAQAAVPDSGARSYAYNHAVGVFYSALKEESPLYNGPEYYFYDPTVTGNAYFADVKSFTRGSVFYDGAEYKGVPMLYDLYSDNVAVLLFNNFLKFSLIKEKVKYFDFLDHHFININTDTIGENKSGIKSGFYDQIYKGKTPILVKRSKSIQTSSGLSGVERYFLAATDFYLKKGKTYYKFSSQGDLLDIFKDQKKPIQQYIKSNQIKYKANPEEAMVRIVSYYDHLTN